MSCAACFSGSIHRGIPTGTVKTLHSLKTYIAAPPAGVLPKGTVVMIPDAFGWEFVNNRLLCDKYAKRGWLVLLPDFMDGHSASPAFVPLMEKKIKGPASWPVTIFKKPLYIIQAIGMMAPWVFYNRVSVCKPRIASFLTQLRIEPPKTRSGKLGAAGFCWGGYHAFLLARNDPKTRVNNKPLIDTAFIAHPSLLKVPQDIEAVSSDVPTTVVVGDEDHAMAMPVVEKVKEVLESKGDRKDFVVTVLKGAKHGFAIRLDPDDEEQNKCAEEAERLAVEWFETHLND